MSNLHFFLLTISVDFENDMDCIQHATYRTADADTAHTALVGFAQAYSGYPFDGISAFASQQNECYPLEIKRISPEQAEILTMASSRDYNELDSIDYDQDEVEKYINNSNWAKWKNI